MLNGCTELLVYLVEPSAVQARAITALMARQGVLHVERFECGGDALARIAVQPPALIVSALYLPDMTGTALVTQLRSREATEHLPFILISSETRPQVLDPVRQSGVCGILPKPFTGDQLATALRATLDYLDSDAGIDADPAELETLQVLIVDDSPSARKFIRRVLGNLGVQHFVEAADGSEAVAILSDKMVDLVITDYNMPEMDGRALVDHIRTQSWQASVPILMVTSEQDAGRLAAVEEAGVSGICDKPFEPQTVRALLAKILRR